MRLSLNWLKEYVNIDVSADELSRLLTMAGLEVEEVTPVGQDVRMVIVAKILAVDKHPGADRLFVCRMDNGRDEVPVVCGAPNLRPGDMVPLALPGAVLPNKMKVKESRIRGELSSGMLLAEDELCLTDDHSGIMILPDNLEPGTELSSAMTIDDYAFDISLTPNRPDCASVIGIAREIAAVTGQKIRIPEIEYKEEGPPITDLAKVDVKDGSGCPRYAAGMIQDVVLGPSPFWMRYRLFVSNVRAINNIVDISNYVLLETGQPLHTFDYDQIKDHRIIVSRAKNHESFTTLDGQERTLNDEHLMICDGERPVALAGIMGGINSEISDNSKNILIESAFFNPVTIRRGSKALGLQTEASYHFERGVDIEGVIYALKRALMLSYQLSEGKINKGIIDIYPEPYTPPVIDLRIEKTNKFLGTSITGDKMVSYLRSLEMKVSDPENGRIQVIPPTYRVDIEREVDLMEEIARLEGYDNIEITYPPVRPSEEKELPSLTLKNRICEILTGLGFSEIITYSFISPESIDKLGVEEDSSPIRSIVTLKNPLTIEQSIMRTSLLPGMLRVIRENTARGEMDLKLFEWGKIFINKGSDQDLPIEKLSLIGAMTGLYQEKTWYNDARTVDFYDIKASVEVILEALSLKNVIFERTEPGPVLHALESCTIKIDNTNIGTLGKVNPKVIKGYDIKTDSILIFELDVDEILENTAGYSAKFEQFAKFPAVLRDLSIIIDRNIDSSPIIDIIKKSGGDLVESVNIFDLYEGEKLGSSKKAVSFRVCYRSKDGTLEGNQVNKIHERVIEKVRAETGGTLSEG